LPALVELANDEESSVRLAGLETVVHILSLLDEGSVFDKGFYLIIIEIFEIRLYFENHLLVNQLHGNEQVCGICFGFQTLVFRQSFHLLPSFANSQ